MVFLFVWFVLAEGVGVEILGVGIWWGVLRGREEVIRPLWSSG